MKKFIYLFSICSLFFNCSDDDDSTNSSDSFISATINGESFMSDDSLLEETGLFFETGSFFGFSIGGFMNDGDLDAATLAITFGGADFDMVINGSEFTNQEDANVLGFYMVTVNGEDIVDADSGETAAFVKITSIDKINNIISGEFNFIATDETDNNATYNITNGVFNNINYIVQE